MARGGSRATSGPPKDPTSGRSEKSGVAFGRLPASGRRGRTPKFPLPPRRIYRWEFEDKRKFQVFDEETTELVAEREAELWRWAWRTPQAVAWEQPHEGWRLQNIAMWVRTFVICEGEDATAADKGALHRFAEVIGFSDGGLARMGYTITVDEVAKKAAEKATTSEPAEEKPKRRLRGVPTAT